MQEDSRIEQLEAKLDLIRENHLAHLSIDVASVKADVSWLKQFFWIVAAASIGGLATGLINLLMK